MATRVTINKGEMLIDLEPITPLPQNFYLFYNRGLHSFMIWAGKLLPSLDLKSSPNLAVCFLVDCNLEKMTMDIQRITSLPLRTVMESQLCQYSTEDFYWPTLVPPGDNSWTCVHGDRALAVPGLSNPVV